jgi:hypothetical protein
MRACDHWYQYKVIHIQESFFNIMKNIFRFQKRELKNFIHDYFSNNDFIFYEIINENFVIKENEIIRNMACIDLLIELFSEEKENNVKKIIYDK